MTTSQLNSESELLFQASGSMKLLRVWMERVSAQTVRTWNQNLHEELMSLKSVVLGAERNLTNIVSFCKQSAAFQSFQEKMHELLNNIDSKDMRVIQIICATIQNQIDYIVNDLDKKRKRLYE